MNFIEAKKASSKSSSGVNGGGVPGTVAQNFNFIGGNGSASKKSKPMKKKAAPKKKK